mgnify:CR=1 FL=1|tara:strand:+ start:86341 stop:87108 length:768 start_codon:yes stop_codon:yes gene_type:complete
MSYLSHDPKTCSVCNPVSPQEAALKAKKAEGRAAMEKVKAQQAITDAQQTKEFSLLLATVYGEALNSATLIYQDKTYTSGKIRPFVNPRNKKVWYDYPEELVEKIYRFGRIKYEKSSISAWKAVASVIMNRVNNYPGSPQTVTEVITQPNQFSAYDLKNQSFCEVMAYLENPEENKEPKDLNNMLQYIKPVYYSKTTKTDATAYFSPLAQQYMYAKGSYRMSASDIMIQRDKEGYEEVEGIGLLPTDDFIFYKRR